MHIGRCVLQIEKTRWRATLAGCRVTVYQHLDGSWSIGYFDADDASLQLKYFDLVG